MKRRSFITATAAALGGCSQLTSSRTTETPAHADEEWPTRGSDVDPVEDRSRSGHRTADDVTSTIHTDYGIVEIVSATAARRVGVTTTEWDQPNDEQIPESEFEWYRAPEGSWFWFVSVNLIDRGRREDVELPPADAWRGEPIRTENETERILSLTSTYDPDPTYFRLPYWFGGTETMPGYGVNHDRPHKTTLVFEVPSNDMSLLYGDPVEASWSFMI